MTADAIHKAIESLKTLDQQDRLSFFARAKVFRALKDLRPWKTLKYNDCSTEAQFWVSINLKPSTVANSLRVLARFGDICENEGIDAVPSRLQKALGVKKSHPDAETELCHLCTDLMPYKDFLETINKAKGKPEQSCNHSGEFEVWHKCKECGTWSEV